MAFPQVTPASFSRNGHTSSCGKHGRIAEIFCDREVFGRLSWTSAVGAGGVRPGYAGGRRRVLICGFGVSDCRLCTPNAEFAATGRGGVDAQMGRLVYLPAGSAGPDPEAFLGDVLTGWRRAQLAQNFTADTVRRRAASVRQMVEFVGRYPWQWSPAGCRRVLRAFAWGEESGAHDGAGVSNRCEAVPGLRTDPGYDWNEHCGRLFGTVFSQVITEFNRARHVQANDARPVKRPFTLEELQQFFDLADLEPERILHSGRKGALSAWRDAVAFKALYGWGLRRNEVRHLQLVDFSRSGRAPMFGEWGLVRVRHGKAMRGSPAKQRTVMTVFDWAAEALADWAERGLPRYGRPVDACFPPRRAGWCPNGICGSGCATSSTNSGPRRAGPAFVSPGLCDQPANRVRLRRQLRAAAARARACLHHLDLHPGRTGLPSP